MRFVVDKVALGQVFFEYFGFPLPMIHSSDYTTVITIYHAGLIQ
jgi:hypothetical protein